MAVPVKKTTKPARSVKYLLSGDRKLQRLSLKKISERVKTAKPEARSHRVKPAAKSPAPMAGALAGRVIAVGVVCLLAAAALLAVRQPADQLDEVSGAPQEAQASAQAPRLTAVANTTPAVQPRSATAASAKPRPASGASVSTAAPAPVKTPERAKAATSATAAPSSTAPVNDAPTRTVEGCLERDGQTYRLKNVSGLDAPKARSWRSGFLMKRSASVEMNDARGGALKLDAHIGQRVATTGTLVNGELHARTLRVVAASCR
jgi:hypothetical protein